MKARQPVILFFVLSFTCLVSFFYFKSTPLLVDEEDNYPQILNFINLNFTLLEISAVPGYHFMMAMLAKVFGFLAVEAIRGISLLFSFFSVVVFYWVANKISTESSVIKTLQYFFFPILFIFFFLLYTDVASILFTLLAFLFVLKKQYHVAGMFGILSMCMRQNNVMWLGFMVLYIFFENYSLKLNTRIAISFLKDIWVFVVGFILFMAFVIINGGVAVGDSASHPAFQINTGNIFYFLFCFFVLFLPMHISNLPKVFQLLKTNKAVLGTTFVLLMLYIFTFRNDHPYNNISPHYYVRNRILIYATSSALLKTIFFLPIAYSVFSIWITPLAKKSHYLLYPFTFLFLLPSWLIEQRYYFIPFVFFLLFKKESKRTTEYATIAYYILILCILFPIVRNGIMFL